MDIELIGFYDDYKVIETFDKKHSPNAVKIIQDKDDEWFYYVITYKKKTGEIKNSSMIIGADLEIWTNYIEKLGYSKK